MASEDALLGAVAAAISNLATNDGNFGVRHGSKRIGNETISLPGPDDVAKSTLEQELSALASRISHLEARANAQGATPGSETGSQDSPQLPSNGDLEPPQRPNLHVRQKSADQEAVDILLSHSTLQPLSPERARKVVNLIESQDQTVQQLEDSIAQLQCELQDRSTYFEVAKKRYIDDSERLNRELVKHAQANNAFQKALREIGNIVTAVADGDLGKKVLVHDKEMDPEIRTFKKAINRMVDQLQDFASEVTNLAKQVGTEGQLGGQARLPAVDGIWLELTNNVNIMAENLTNQVREIATVTKAVAHGDLSRKIERPAKGEILELQQTINVMVDQLRTFATEVTRVARDVGTEGALGGQAQIEGVKGMWNDLTVNVNAMANNLTTQVRDIAKVTTAVAKGDLTQKVSATCKGEILDLKTTINSMVDQLQQFAHEVTNLAQEVGTEGRLGGQATVHGVEGTWKDLTQNVNVMAMKLVSFLKPTGDRLALGLISNSRQTTQVREIALVTTAVARGDLSKKIGADVKGEVMELKNTINSMVDRLGIFAFEVSKVAREVGTEGTLGGQAQVEHVEGKWKDLTDNVNTMAQVSSDFMSSKISLMPSIEPHGSSAQHL